MGRMPQRLAIRFPHPGAEGGLPAQAAILGVGSAMPGSSARRPLFHNPGGGGEVHFTVRRGPADEDPGVLQQQLHHRSVARGARRVERGGPLDGLVRVEVAGQPHPCP